MKTEAMVIEKTGDADVLVRKTIDLREPGAKEVRVRIHAVALNHLDVWTRRGLPHLAYDFPHRLGADIAGEVEAAGSEVTNDLAKPGAKVLLNPGISCGA